MTRTCAAFGCNTNLKERDGENNRVINYETVFKFPFIPEHPRDNNGNKVKINITKLLVENGYHTL